MTNCSRSARAGTAVVEGQDLPIDVTAVVQLSLNCVGTPPYSTGHLGVEWRVERPMRAGCRTCRPSPSHGDRNWGIGVSQTFRKGHGVLDYVRYIFGHAKEV